MSEPSVSESIRVLVVEDESIAADAHAEYVRRADGFELAAVATTGAEALKVMAESARDSDTGAIHLMLLDMNLPDIHGLDIIHRVRGAGFSTGIIAVTAVRELPIVQRAVAAGVAQYLIKPFTFSSFSEKLSQFKEFHESMARQPSTINQSEVDKTLAALRSPGTANLPKGMSEATLAAVVDLLQTAHAGVSATEVMDELGMSRVTARRYLEHLATDGSAVRTPRYGTPGRPEYEYRWGARKNRTGGT
ncbi:response regulator [Arthrobacter castelli]|uniref:response regulator n=1 Tax=Arthrobacter castelli TaxID=271431 RepID=UPI000567F3D9|nr:response regulator [Arthrobacter castelli]